MKRCFRKCTPSGLGYSQIDQDFYADDCGSLQSLQNYLKMNPQTALTEKDNRVSAFLHLKSHITKLPFHVFWEILTPYSRLSYFPAPIFFNMLKTADLPQQNFPNIIFSKMIRHFLEYYEFKGSWTRPEIRQS